MASLRSIHRQRDHQLRNNLRSIPLRRCRQLVATRPLADTARLPQPVATKRPPVTRRADTLKCGRSRGPGDPYGDEPKKSITGWVIGESSWRPCLDWSAEPCGQQMPTRPQLQHPQPLRRARHPRHRGASPTRTTPTPTPTKTTPTPTPTKTTATPTPPATTKPPVVNQGTTATPTKAGPPIGEAQP